MGPNHYNQSLITWLEFALVFCKVKNSSSGHLTEKLGYRGLLHIMICVIHNIKCISHIIYTQYLWYIVCVKTYLISHVFKKKAGAPVRYNSNQVSPLLRLIN